MVFYASCRKQPNDTISMPTDNVSWIEGKEPVVRIGDRVCILIHGYRSDFYGIQHSYSSIFNRIGRNYEHVIGFIWPGGWSRISFWTSGRRARASSEPLERLVMELSDKQAVVDIQTHSLGAEVALGVDSYVRNILLTAPAVGAMRVLDTNYQPCKRMVIYFSRYDPVLKVWYRVSKFGFGRALGLRPIVRADYPNLRFVDCSNIIHDHGGYRKSQLVMEHWERVLRGSDRGLLEVLE